MEVIEHQERVEPLRLLEVEGPDQVHPRALGGRHGPANELHGSDVVVICSMIGTTVQNKYNTKMVRGRTPGALLDGPDELGHQLLRGHLARLVEVELPHVVRRGVALAFIHWSILVYDSTSLSYGPTCVVTTALTEGSVIALNLP